MVNLRKEFINKVYFKYIRDGKSPLLQYTDKLLNYSEKKRLDVKHAVAQKYPNIIKADVEIVAMALTSQCNLRCEGCSYGRGFMPKEHLSLDIVKETLDSMKEMGIPYISLYGGDPTMIGSSDLVEIVSYATKLGIYSNLGTNGILLTPKLMDKLYEAGLRRVFIGVYGIGEEYDKYVKQKGAFDKLEQNIAYIREKYPDVAVNLGWLLMKPTCNLQSTEAITQFIQKHSIDIYITLVHYDFPYFNNGEDEELQLFEEDLPQIKEVIEEFIRLKKAYPQIITNSLTALNSIPDWLIKKG
ncbi:radical SAM protein, partial [Sulfurovum sp. bin170]|uniref:radical SAM protein n=1 Tax=Sulfurovum sp. bin170 TaxID=2695268 RepID=UPI0013DF8530|nr:radical SAM protein [Sulfurovum sp. bin170]